MANDLEQTGDDLRRLTKSPKTTKHKAKFAFATDGTWVESETLVEGETLDSVSSNRVLSDASVTLTKKKPFDVLAEELLSEKSRGDRIRTCDLVAPNDALYQAELHPEV